MKRLTAVSLILLALALIFSCSTEPEDITERADLEITTSEVKTRTILPVTPDITSYTVTLTGPETYTKDFSPSDPIQFSGILVGSYTIKVEGKTEDGTIVAEGNESVTVSASGPNSAVIYLSYLTSGTGTMVIDISWEERTTGSGPFDEALEHKKLSFQAMNNETGEAYGPLLEVGEDDFAAKKLTYVAEGLQPSDGTTIYFDIYTEVAGKPQVIARTFYTVVQIIPNLTSMPDSNETNNFKITDESIIQYIKNVRKSSVKAIINEENPDSAIDIEWEYPKLSNGNFNATLTVSLYKEGDDSLIDEKKFDYNNETDRTGTLTIGGGVNDIELSPNDSYYVTFQNTSETGYSQVLTALTGIKTKVTVTGIEITSKVEEYYTMGDILKVDATITPEDATDKDYTISVTNSESVTINQEAKTVTFNSSGDYTITVTPNDISSSVSATANTYVKLSIPENFSANLTEEGISLSWAEVSSADGYVIEKTVPDVGNSQIEANDENTTSDGNTITYVDTQVYAGKTHTYTIKAIRNDNEKYNSLPSSEASVSIKSTDIEIINPPDITTQELPKIDFGNQYLVEGASSDEEHYSISISLNAAIEGATNYEWLLNDVSIANSATFSSEVQNVTITADTEGLDFSRLYETENTLKLIVTVGGKMYNTSGTFYVVSEALDGLEIVQADGNAVPDKIVYGSDNAIQLQVKTSPEISYVPEVIWENLTPEIIELTDNHTIKALCNGTGRIKVTATATGISTEMEIQSYIPAKAMSLELDIRNSTDHELKVENNPGIFFITKTGVEVTPGFDTHSPTTLIANVTPANEGQANAGTTSTITWSSSAPEIIDVDSEGKLIFNETQQSGTVTITATIDDITQSQTLHIYDMDIQMREGDGSFQPVTGTTQNTSAIGRSRSYDLKLIFSSEAQGTYQNNNVNNLNTIWCFNNDESLQQVGTKVVIDYFVTLSNPSKTETEFLVDLDRDMSTADDPLVTAIMKYNDIKVCTVSFTAEG